MSKDASSGYVYGGANAGKWKPDPITGEAPMTKTPPNVEATLLTREFAKSKGFTGDMCSNCGSMNMQMAGHCQVCSDCGTTTGCS